jgi:lipopolysaccharide transport system permease protein
MEIWQKRSLVFALALNDIKLRYKNSFLGFVWSFLEPLLILTVLFFVFTHIIKNTIESYPLYLLLGLIIWYMFTRSTTMGLSSLTDKAHIIQKIYLRKEIFVISSCLTGFIMMLIEFAAFGVFLAVFSFVPPYTIFLLPVLLIELFILSVGISLLLSILNIYFRDIKFIWQVILQAGFFLTPIIYSFEMFPPKIRTILELNPISHLITTGHDLVLYGTLPTINSVLYVMLITGSIFVLGYMVFRKMESKIAEEL